VAGESFDDLVPKTGVEVRESANSFHRRGIMNCKDLSAFLASYPGGVSLEEGQALSRYAETCINSVIVEIGSFKGKSAIALAFGQAQGPFAETGLVYCVEPHQPFTGLYGGVFGADDRRDFYEIMLKTGFFKRVCLISLKSAVAAKGWNRPIGLLFVDGDHTLDGARSDLFAWERHVATGGIIIFDDATDLSAGPYHVVNELVQGGQFKRQDGIGKMVALRKIATAAGCAGDQGRRILVACHEMSVAGGHLRFERFGRVIRRFGHHLAFMAFSDTPQRESHFPVLTFEEASRATWDVTVSPGAGFPEATINRFSEFRSPRFGLRVQHILNDQTRKSAFLHLNRAFKPDVVIFNNRHWQPGDFTEFQADAFHFLEGAVDVEGLAPDPKKRSQPRTAPFVVGGLAHKNVKPLIEAVRICGEGVNLYLFGHTGDLADREHDLVDTGRLRLYGVLEEGELSDFYSKIDCVAHTETFAGWANIAAEGMASGVPVVCTPHGTGAFAEHEKTALVIPRATPEALAEAIQRLRADPNLAGRLANNARRCIKRFSWTSYSADLLRLMKRPSTSYYTWSPELGLFGKWPEAERTTGLDRLFAECPGKTILDLGAGEGVLARRFLEQGAIRADGFERESSRVMLATRICDHLPGARFWEADLSDWCAFETNHATHLLERYNIVLYLGLHHHLPASSRLASLAGAAARASDWIALRMRAPIFVSDGIAEFLAERGFSLVDAQSGNHATGLSGSYVFSRSD
jgi:glycosyltransferase involved in cell wall biosynthesis